MLDTLATKYRPQTFEDVCEQRSVVDILKRQIEVNAIRNAYLFAGSSGCGKTTLARIFAKCINKGQGEPIEIDAASNNGVDNVRELIQEAQARSINSEYKVYILDECHMLTTAAWNAFLKCIEEPPKYTVFIFCTTDPQKIPATIQNRVMRFNISKISLNTIKSRLEYICKNEGFTNYTECIDYIAKICDGSMRTAISYLEKVASYNPVLSMESATFALGDFSDRTLLSTLWYMTKHDELHILATIDDLYNKGIDLKQFVSQYMSFVLDVIKYSIFQTLNMTKIPQSNEETLKSHFMFEDCAKLYNYYVDTLLELSYQIKYDINPRCAIEVTFLQMTRHNSEVKE